MRPWWSPVSIVLFSASDPPVTCEPGPCLFPASQLQSPQVFSTSPPTPPPPSYRPWLQICNSQPLPLPGPDCVPSSSQISSWELSHLPPPLLQLFIVLALPLPPQLTGPSPCRFLPEPPSHGGRRSSLCPTLHPADPEVSRKTSREGEPHFSLFPPFLTVHSSFSL